MSVDFGAKRMRATTVAIEDPGPLHRFLAAGQPGAAFIRRRDGFVALGQIARFDTDYPEAADVWWDEVAGSIDHDSELPGAFGAGPLAVGSFTFDPERSAERSTLIVPEIIIGRRDGLSWLTKLSYGNCSLTLPDLGEPFEKPSRVTLTEGTVSEETWKQLVSKVIELINQGEVSKVVLARDLVATATTELDPRHILDRLLELYPSCWGYLVDGLVGATPELLIRRQGGLATSRVLAGTVSTDPDHVDPTMRAAELSNSSKEVAEHEFAVESVAHALAPYCSGMNVPESPSVLRLPNVLHLATDITGVCEPEASALGLAAALHPSAAVCGTPTFLARDVISDLESLERGRYSGPVGWVDASGDGEWAIALRGGRISPTDPHQLQLFAGCGIVADSEPAAELAETSAKFLPMLQALDLA